MSSIQIATTLQPHTLRKVTRSVPFLEITRVLLPRNYTLSLMLTGDTRARRLNRAYRNKTYAPNVLSFPLSKNEGEIILNIRKAEREARTAEIRPEARIAHLFIHGICHLGGMKHGNAMDRKEKAVLKKFGFPSPF